MCLSAVKKDYRCIKWESCGLNDDEDVMLQLVRYDPDALEFASFRLKNPEILPFSNLTLDEDTEWLLEMVGVRHANRDSDFAWECLAMNGLTLKCLSVDRDYVTQAVQNYGCALEYASNKLKNDRQIVSLAVQQCYRSFEFASNELTNDPNFVKSLNRFAFEYVSEALRNDKEFVLSVQQECKDYEAYWVVRYMSITLNSDIYVMMAVVSTRGFSLLYGPYDIHNNIWLIRYT